MKRILILSFIISGCVSNEPKGDCVEWRSFPTNREVCTGGRGVAPTVCVIDVVDKLICVRYTGTD